MATGVRYMAGKELYQPSVLKEILQRLNTLKSDSARQWGKMDVAQMFAHCSVALEIAAGQRAASRIFIGRILGPLFKGSYVGDKPLRKNGRTGPALVIADRRDFDFERQRLGRI